MDVGFSMSNSSPGEESPFDLSKKVIQKFVQRQVTIFFFHQQPQPLVETRFLVNTFIFFCQVFAETKDEVALVLFGTDATKNPLEQDEQYQNIVVHRHLMVPDFDLLEEIEHQIHPEGQQADCIFFVWHALVCCKKGY